MTTAVNADAARIIGQLQEGHAAMNAAGLGSPALDDFNNLLTEQHESGAFDRVVVASVASHVSEAVVEGVQVVSVVLGEVQRGGDHTVHVLFRGPLACCEVHDAETESFKPRHSLCEESSAPEEGDECVVHVLDAGKPGRCGGWRRMARHIASVGVEETEELFDGS